MTNEPKTAKRIHEARLKAHLCSALDTVWTRTEPSVSALHSFNLYLCTFSESRRIQTKNSAVAPEIMGGGCLFYESFMQEMLNAFDSAASAFTSFPRGSLFPPRPPSACVLLSETFDLGLPPLGGCTA